MTTSNPSLKSDEKAVGMFSDKDLARMALSPGALGMEYSWNYQKQMSVPFCLMLAPMLKKIYMDDPKGYSDSLARHLEFFNVTHYLAPFVGGVVLSMEELVAKDEIKPEAVSQVKTALMGPISGIGDAFFLNTLRVVCAGIGVSLSLSGSILGPIVFLLAFNIPAFACRIFGARAGYHLGVSFLSKAQESGMMSKIVTAAGIVGIMVIGSMTVSMTSVSIPISFGSGESVTAIQSVLDGIMPGMLALVALIAYYIALSKKVNPMLLIVFTMAIGVAGAFFGVLG